MNRKQKALEERYRNNIPKTPKKVPVFATHSVIKEIKTYCKNAIYANKTGSWTYYSHHSNAFIQAYNEACKRGDYNLGYEEYWTQMEHLMIEAYYIQNSKLAKVLA